MAAGGCARKVQRKGLVMKFSISLIGFAVLIFVTGCQSGHGRVSTARRESPQVPQVTYTVESIPAPHLSATSREGDKPGPVYSSNIIAVYAHRTYGTNASVQNGSAIGKTSER
jgi:hypothetical protein